MKPSSRPNLVFIITDNQSPWTLGAYGNREFMTPSLDRMAREGVRFEHAYCVNPVCSPNRATCLTGLIPSQHGVHNWLGQEKPDAQMGPSAYCTIREFTNLPRLLADAGYCCGLSGKWHLGDSLHPQLGFSWWFTKPYGHTARFYEDEAIWKGRVYKEPRYMTDAITQHAVDFLRQADRPFFLYVGFNAPYGLGEWMRREHRNRWTAYYADKEFSFVPEADVHPWLVNYRDLVNNPRAMRNYAAAVSGVDDGVGVILETLRDLGVEEETLVIFTADHGLCGGHHGLWGMGDHSWPMHMYDPNLHIPLIFRHPGVIPPGGVCRSLVANYDLFPTLLEYFFLDPGAGDGLERPGRSFMPALMGRPLDWEQERRIYHEYEVVRAVRTPHWKLILRLSEEYGPDELYDLTADPGETTNLIEAPDFRQVREALVRDLSGFFERYAVPEYDLWRGGRSKAGLMWQALMQRTAGRGGAAL